jgi:hypothetical protein
MGQVLRRTPKQPETTYPAEQTKHGRRLNAADANHVEEAFRTKLLSFAIHQAKERWGRTRMHQTLVAQKDAAGRQVPHRHQRRLTHSQLFSMRWLASARLSTFPYEFRGSSDTIWICRGTLYGVRFCRQWASSWPGVTSPFAIT